MWTYIQRLGMLQYGGKAVAVGYSGNREGKNNPSMEQVHNVGPIPCGRYTIGAPEDTKTHGPCVLRLTPYETNRMFGRSGFLIHGDSVVDPGSASEGCIIMPRNIRERIWQSKDTVLEVIAQ